MKIRLKKTDCFYKLVYGKYKRFNDGYMFEYGGIEFVVGKGWSITHLQSGAAINIVGGTRKECLQNFIKRFPTPESCRETFDCIDMKMYIYKHGVNPMYSSMDENLEPDFFGEFIKMGKEIEI